MRVPFLDLKAQYQSIKEDIDLAIHDVLNKTSFLYGEHVSKFERDWAAVLGAKHCVAVGNGTDSLEILLKALEVGAGDEVIVPSHTWVSTAEAVVTVGATPVFVDTVDRLYTIDTTKIEKSITPRTKAIIPVHMCGLSADMDPIMRLASHYKLWVIEDCAQSPLAEYKGRKTGTIGHAGSFSFYPSKNLGAYGDAGAIVVNDDDLALKCRRIANHGRLHRNDHQIAGRNSRMDAMQAAILSVKLSHLQRWTDQRIGYAEVYRSMLDKRFNFTNPDPEYLHVYHLFIIQVDNREAVVAHLKDCGIETGIHYPTPVPLTLAFAGHSLERNLWDVSQKYSEKILSLPLYPELTVGQLEFVSNEINSLR